MRRFLALALCLVIAACGTASRQPGTRRAASAKAPSSRWPHAADYTTIATAVKARDQALRLRAWNQKAEAAQLAMRTLVSLAGAMRDGKCAQFVAHIYNELTDLSQAYAGERWQPMYVVVARDPTVASQCRAPVSRHNFHWKLTYIPVA